MKFLRSFLLAATLTLFLSSCSSVLVSQDYDSAASFSDYRQFAFAAKDPERKTDPRYDNELINQRFYRTISSILQDKGFEFEETAKQSDFTVSFDFSVRPKMDLYNINRQVGFSFGSYNRYGGVGAKTCTDISEFDQGLLFINVTDSDTGRLVWRGTGADIVSIYATPEKLSAQVEEMVAAVLKDFPPQ